MEDIGHLFEGDPLSVSGVRHRPDYPKRPVSDGPVRFYVQLLLEVVCVCVLLLMVVMVVVVSFDGSSLNLGGSRRRCRPGGLSRGRRGEVRLLLARVEHHGGSSCRGGVLLDRVHCGGRARMLQVMLPGVVVVVHVWRRKVLELVVVVRVMGSHCR